MPAIPAAARSAAGEPSMYVRVVSPANADDEVFNTYGELGNAKLLSSYGFAQRDNPADRVTLGVPALRAAAAMRGAEGASMASRLAWCERAGVLRDAMEFHLSSEEPPPRELLLAIWILTANEEAFRTVRAAGEAARDDGETDVGARVVARAESIVGGGLRTSAANAVFAEALRRRRALYAEPPGVIRRAGRRAWRFSSRRSLRYWRGMSGTRRTPARVKGMRNGGESTPPTRPPPTPSRSSIKRSEESTRRWRSS